MKISSWNGSGLLIGLLLLVATNIGYASEAPPNVASALILKLAPFEKNLSGAGGTVTIHVIGSPAIAAAFAKAKGTKMGKGELGGVTESNGLPTYTPSILFVADASKQAEAVEWAKANKVLCATNLPDLVAKGVALGIGFGADGKPEVFLNQAASKDAGLIWNPAILKIAKITK